MLQLISAFQSAGFSIVFGSPADWSPHAVAMEEYGIKPVRIALNCDSFNHFVRELNPAVVMFDRFMMEEQFGWRVEAECPEAVRLLDMEDVHSLRHGRHQWLKQQTDDFIPQQLPRQYAHSELAIREVAAILRCDLTLVISEYEMQWLQQSYQVPAHQLLYSPFMLDPDCIDQTPAGFAERRHFVCIGNFRHEPNWDAVRWMRERLWPQIRKQLPDAELHIYGAYPPKKATQLHNDKLGFLVKGWAEDALEVIRGSRVMLAPLRFGAGLKGKLIDAAQTGTPVVTSSIGAEGMYNQTTAAAAMVADDLQALADAAVTVYRDETLWRQSQQAALQLISERFDSLQHQRVLTERLTELVADIQSHRQQGFYGMMLRHHSMKSTRYMSQWIEAKTRLAEVLARSDDEVGK